MKWITHKTIAVGAAVILELPPAFILTTLLGSVLPDIIDQRVSRMTPNPQKTFNAIHRGVSHWFGWYALLLSVWVLGIYYPRSMGSLHMDKTLLHCLGGLGFGGLFHIFLDMCTPSGVPLSLFSPKNRVSLKLFSTGSVQEYVFLGLVLSLFVAIGYDDFPALLRELQRMI